MDINLNRRVVLKAGLAAGLGVGIWPNILMGKDDRKVRLGFIGVGGRGSGLLKKYLGMADVEVPAICDVVEENLGKAVDMVEKSGRKRPTGYCAGEEDFRNLVARDDLDGVVIAAPWRWHIPMAIAAMRCGKYAATEVGPANSVEECIELVRTYEETGKPCMMLENYCYTRNHMAVLNMVRQGLFGEMVHCQCGYLHDLRKRIVQGKGTGVKLAEGGDYRSRQNRLRNGDIYPTHGVGPMAHYLKINRGNKFNYLTSTASKSCGLNAWAEDNHGKDDERAKINWAMGDVVTTTIKCHNGETLLVVHDVALPRPRAERSLVQGTKGIWMTNNDSMSGSTILLEGMSPEGHKGEPFDKYQTKYEHPVWKEYLKKGIQGGHWGTDYLALRAFADSVKNGTATPIDVYDTASWMVISPLTEKSIANGSSPVEFPDFTKGKWKSNKPIFCTT